MIDGTRTTEAKTDTISVTSPAILAVEHERTFFDFAGSQPTSGNNRGEVARVSRHELGDGMPSLLHSSNSPLALIDYPSHAGTSSNHSLIRNARESEARAPLTLDEVIKRVRSWESGFQTVRASITDVGFRSDCISHGGCVWRVDQDSRDRLFRKVAAPASYFRELSAEFQARALVEHAKRGDFGRMVDLVVSDDELITIASGNLVNLSAAAVLTTIREALDPAAQTLFVQKIELDFEHLEIDLVSQEKVLAVRPGDVVQAGIHVEHSRFGREATVVAAYVLRLVCRNGMMRRECEADGLTRTRRLPAEFPNAEALQMEQIRKLAQQNWRGLQAQLGALKATAERHAHVEDLLRRWLERTRLSLKLMMPKLIEAWHIEGSENSIYGAVNAITRVATHDEKVSRRQRRMLATLAGLLSFAEVHLCDRCSSVLMTGGPEF